MAWLSRHKSFRTLLVFIILSWFAVAILGLLATQIYKAFA
jgi:hypothetical protein